MTWAKLDDDLPHHPKVVKAGPTAAWLFVAGLCYSGRYLTDGVIDKGQLRALAVVDRPEREAALLVDVGLWEDHGDHFVIHDYHDYNPPADKVRHQRAQERERKTKARGTQARAPDGRMLSGSRPPGQPPGHLPDVPPESAPRPPGQPQAVPPDVHRSRSLESKSKPSSSSPSDLHPEPDEPVEEEEDSIEQENPVDVLIRAACDLLATDELRSFQIRKPDDAPPARSDREELFLSSSRRKAWSRHADRARKLLDDSPHLDAFELAAALVPSSAPVTTGLTNHEDLVGAAQKRRRDEAEEYRRQEESLALADAERRAEADELLAKMSTEDRDRLESKLRQQFGPSVRRPVIESAMRSAVLEQAS